MDNLLAYEVRLQEHEARIAASSHAAWRDTPRTPPGWHIALARAFMHLALRLAPTISQVTTGDRGIIAAVLDVPSMSTAVSEEL